jgi:hypothetical protein
MIKKRHKAQVPPLKRGIGDCYIFSATDEYILPNWDWKLGISMKFSI